MNDKELLEAAAKAAGYEYLPRSSAVVINGIPSCWNPLEDDGDAFRLAVDLGIFDSFKFRDQSLDLLCGYYPSHRRLIVELAAKGIGI